MNGRTMRAWLTVGVAAALLGAAVAGCTQRREPRLRGQDVGVAKDVAPILQGTIAAQASLSGLDPVYVTGYGVVVGLNGVSGRSPRTPCQNPAAIRLSPAARAA